MRYSRLKYRHIQSMTSTDESSSNYSSTSSSTNKWGCFCYSKAPDSRSYSNTCITKYTSNNSSNYNTNTRSKLDRKCKTCNTSNNKASNSFNSRYTNSTNGSPSSMRANHSPFNSIKIMSIHLCMSH